MKSGSSEVGYRIFGGGVGGKVALALIGAVFFYSLTNVNSPSGQQESKYATSGTSFASNQPTTTWQKTSVHELDIVPSSYECSDDEPVRQHCMFKDMVLYNGQLIYVAKDANAAITIQLPDPGLFEVFNSPSNYYSTSLLIEIKTKAQIQELITSGLKTMPPATPLMSMEFQQAIFGRTRTFRNWFWVVNGAGLFYHRFCKYFGACTYEDIRNTAILHPMLNSTDLTDTGYIGLPNELYTAVKDIMNCFGTILWVNHGDAIIQTTRKFDDRVVLLKNLLLGIGSDVVHPRTTRKATGEIYYDQASNEMGIKRTQYLRQCAGIPIIPAARKRPRILLVNRAYSDGRSILGLDDIYDRLRRELASDIDVEILLPRGTMTLNAQAAAFDNSDIVIVPHGAANGNVNFLPYNGIAIVVYALEGRYAHEYTLVESLPSPPYNMTSIGIDCSKKVETWSSAALALPEMQNLDAETIVKLMNTTDMSSDRKDNLEAALGMSRLSWMDYKAYRPDPVEVVEIVKDAVALWESKPAPKWQ